jgi:hypothetical protein
MATETERLLGPSLVNAAPTARSCSYIAESHNIIALQLTTKVQPVLEAQFCHSISRFAMQYYEVAASHHSGLWTYEFGLSVSDGPKGAAHVRILKSIFLRGRMTLS